MNENQKEYMIEIIMTPHYHDNLQKPYFWCILENCENEKSNRGSGWAATPEDSFKEALSYYKSIFGITS